MDRVWGYAAAFDTGTVTVHIRRLREKIEPDPAHPAAPADGLGRRLQARPVIALALVVAASSLAVGARCRLRAAGGTERLAAARRPRVPLGLRSARRRAALGLGDVPHGRRREDPRSSRPCSATAAVVASLILARSIARSIRRVSASAQELAAGDLSARAPGGRHGELAQLARSFNTMASSLEQLFDARRELVVWASHDLRTPIASMQAMLEAIEDGLASARRVPAR